MKNKIISLITSFLLLTLFLFSCGNGEDSDIPEDSEGEVTDKPAQDSDGGSNTGNGNEDGEHTHTYGAWITVKDATCASTGSKARVCHCGDTETETIAALGHNYVNGKCKTCNEEKPSAFVPDYATGEANTVGSEDPAFSYTAQAGYIYYSDGNKIFKANKNTTTVKTVYTAKSGNIFSLNVVGDWLYFFCDESTAAKSYIARVRTDGSEFQTIVSSVYVSEILVVKDTIYYTTYNENWSYKDYAKENHPLYSVSVNGGSPKQIHDGAVENLNADASYLYFTHYDENDKSAICRIKHSNLNKDILLQKSIIIDLCLDNSKLYFFVPDQYDSGNLTLASITVTGGSYTTYADVYRIADSFQVIGSKMYFMGCKAPSEENMEPDFGLIEFDLTKKTFKVLRIEYESDGFFAIPGGFVYPTYNADTYKLDYVEIYDPTAGTFKKVKKPG